MTTASRRRTRARGRPTYVGDKWGNVVSYTLTIEQTGGSGITVPGRGFLLNNELTDFNFEPPTPAGRPEPAGPGQAAALRMSPTIVLDDGKPLLALGSPGGSTIITTVLQTLLNRVDLGMPLVKALTLPAPPSATRRRPRSSRSCGTATCGPNWKLCGGSVHQDP